MNKKRIGLIFIIIGLVGLVVGIAWGEYNIWDSYRAGKEADRVLQSIVQYREEHAAQNEAEATPDKIPDRQTEMPTVEIDGYRYIGTVTIPTIDVDLPVMETWDYTRMKIAPCRYRGSVYSDDLIICGHNYSSHLGRLGNLQTGDQVIFTDINGTEYQYTVVEKETLDGTAIEQMQSGDWDLTLFTCTLSGQTRTTVRCTSVKEAS